MSDAFSYIKNNNGISFETNYPYTSGKTGTVRYHLFVILFEICF